MPRPTVRLCFTDGTHYDAYYSTFFRLVAIGPHCTYRTPRFSSVSHIYPGDTLDVPPPDDGGDVRRVTLARKESL